MPACEISDPHNDETGDPPLRIAVLIVCHNRIKQTLSALGALRCDEPNVDIRPVLFDDGSTDGTAQEVAVQFPQTVILQGDGNQFWNRGLYHAWTEAIALGADAYLWLNDDVVLAPGAIDKLVLTHRELMKNGQSSSILVASTVGASGDVTYGGYRLVPSPFSLKLQRTTASRELTPIDTFNGNIVYVPQSVVAQIGINDPNYYHNFGDNDYGLRARDANIPILLVKTPLGTCEINDAKRKRGCGSPELGIFGQWRVVNTHHGLPFGSWWRFTRKFSGIWLPLHFALPYRHLFIPRFLKSVGRYFVQRLH